MGLREAPGEWKLCGSNGSRRTRPRPVTPSSSITYRWSASSPGESPGTSIAPITRTCSVFYGGCPWVAADARRCTSTGVFGVLVYP